MTRYIVGDPVVLTNTFTVGSTPTDPDTVSLEIVEPDGTSTVYTYAAAQITKSSTGVYTKTITTDAAGTWTYLWTGTGSAADVEDGNFRVFSAADLKLYTNTTAVKSILGITGTTPDEELQRAINTACRAIDRWCSQRFWADPADTTRYFTPDHPTSLDLLTCSGDLEAATALTVTSLTVDVDLDGTFSETWTEGTDFYLAPRGASASSNPFTRIELLPAAGRRFQTYDGMVKVVGKFGRDEIPYEVEQAAIQLSARIFKESREAPFGVVVFGDGLDGGTVRTGRLMLQVSGLLEPFRRLAVY